MSGHSNKKALRETTVHISLGSEDAMMPEAPEQEWNAGHLMFPKSITTTSAPGDNTLEDSPASQSVTSEAYALEVFESSPSASRHRTDIMRKDLHEGTCVALHEDGLSERVEMSSTNNNRDTALRGKLDRVTEMCGCTGGAYATRRKHSLLTDSRSKFSEIPKETTLTPQDVHSATTEAGNVHQLHLYEGTAAKNELVNIAAHESMGHSTGTAELHIGLKPTLKHGTLSGKGSKNSAPIMMKPTINHATELVQKSRRHARGGSTDVFPAHKVNIDVSNLGVRCKHQTSMKLPPKTTHPQKYAGTYACGSSPGLMIMKKHRPKVRRKAKSRRKRRPKIRKK